MKIDFPLVVIRGAGDLASGVALRLQRAGFPVVMTEIAQPLAVRRTVVFAQAIFDGFCQVEEVGGRRCELEDVTLWSQARVRFLSLVDPQADITPTAAASAWWMR